MGIVMRSRSLSKTAFGLAVAGLTAIVLALTAPAATAKPAYVGIWSTSAAQCAPDDAVVEIKLRTLLEPDAECRFQSVSGGRGVWHARAKCFGEASPAKTPVRITIWATAKRLTLKYGADPHRYNYVRCH
jgi:hypothetical protein